MLANRCRNAGLAIAIIANLLLAGCAYPRSAEGKNDAEIAQWRGRLALRVDPDNSAPSGNSGEQSQSFSASFELTGNAQSGGLLLFSPLGTTVAELTWTAQTAAMRANGETRSFNSLAELLKQATGTEIPVASLFGWLAGNHVSTPGWLADLSQYGVGRVVARRSDPAPAVELRLIFEK